MDLRRFYAVAQVVYCQNFIFRRNFPIRRLFQRACELGIFSLTADKLSHIFGWRVTKKFRGKLQIVLERVEQGHHIMRAHFKNSFVKQYEKFRTFLRLEVCSNHLPDFRVGKSLLNLGQAREAFRAALDRFASLQGQAFNAHFDFPLLQKLAMPLTCVNTRIAGIKIQDSRMIRLMETLLQAGACLGGWTAGFIHSFIVAHYELPTCTLNQLRYDLRKMKAHGLIERNGRHYSYFLTEQGVKVAVIFFLFHKRLCGPLSNSLFKHRPDPNIAVESELERALNQADKSITQIIDLLAA